MTENGAEHIQLFVAWSTTPHIVTVVNRTY